MDDFKSVLRTPTAAGLLGSSFGFAVGYPFDVIKSFSQLEQTPSMIQSIKIIYNRFGFMGFYNGILTPLLCISAVKGTLFATYDFVLTSPIGSSIPDDGLYKYIKMAIAGSFGAVTSSFINSPVELIKLSYQRGVPFFSNFKFADIKTTLLKGLPETILRETPFYMTYFPLYNYCKDNNIPFAGGIAGTIPWIIIYPLDVIKTYKQNPINNNIPFTQFYAKYGKRTLINGLFPTILRAFPTHLATWIAYEQLIQI